MTKPVTFSGPGDYKRMASAVRGFEATKRDRGQNGSPVGVGSSHSAAHFKCLGAYNANAKGWPGKLTYRNLTSGYPSEDWKDGEEVYAEEINGQDLEVSRRYRCHVYGLKPWITDGNPVESMFVLVDISAGGGTDTQSIRCGQVAGWSSDDCVYATVISKAGKCSAIINQSLTLAWDAGDGRWESGDNAVDLVEDDFVHLIGVGQITFGLVNGVPTATIRSGASTVYGTYIGCDADGRHLFSFGGSLLCNGTYVQCGDNTFVVAFSCICCPDPDWTGPGWYCIDSECVYLPTPPPCVGVYDITSGPHATEADCISACGGGPGTVSVACCAEGELLPTTLTITISGMDTGTTTLTWDGSSWVGSGTSTGGVAYTFELECVGGDWYITWHSASSPIGTSGDCTPFLVEGGPFTNWAEDPGILVYFSITT